MNEIQEILTSEDKAQKKALFEFDLDVHTNKQIELKFNLWVRYHFPLQFKHKDAKFHSEIDDYNLSCYRGSINSFTDIVFRGGAKTTRTKMFYAFVVVCDKNHYRRFMKILTKDLSNAKQLVTDIYNILINNKVKALYPHTFTKTKEKREQTMGSFTTSFGVKVKSGTVGTDQRGQVQGDEESARPDLIWFDDFETRKTLRSAVETQMIWDNMEEARTGLSKDGACIYTCNYISERGNVHRLVMMAGDLNVLLVVPILDEMGEPTWNLYTKEEIELMRGRDDDFEGERMCEPSAGTDVMFDRETLKEMTARTVKKEYAGFKTFYEYNPSHRYGGGADIAGGVSLDSSTSVFIDFSTIPARVVGVFANNAIKPDVFGDELERQCLIFGKPIIAPENNKFDMCIGRLKQIYDKIYYTEAKDKDVRGMRPRTFGWNTNRLTKPKMIFDLKKAVEDGLLQLTDQDLINECMSYTRDDLMDGEIDPRLTTRHFDLLIACAIAWQMKDWAEPVAIEEDKETIYSKLGVPEPQNNVANPFCNF